MSPTGYTYSQMARCLLTDNVHSPASSAYTTLYIHTYSAHAVCHQKQGCARLKNNCRLDSSLNLRQPRLNSDSNKELFFPYNIKKIDESLTSPRHLNEIIIAKIYVLIFRPTGLPQNEQCTLVYKNTRIQSNH